MMITGIIMNPIFFFILNLPVLDKQILYHIKEISNNDDSYCANSNKNTKQLWFYSFLQHDHRWKT